MTRLRYKKGWRKNNIGKMYCTVSLHQTFFCAPMVLFSRGFDKVAFSNFDVLFQHSLRSIKGPIEDADKLMFLRGIYDQA